MLKPRKRLVKAKLKEDRFVIFTAKAEVWFEQNRRHVIYGAGGIIVVVALAVAMGWSKSNATKNAAFQELLARDAYARTDYDSTLIRANAILEDFSGTSSAAVALMLKGRVYEQRGQFEEAEEAFKQVVDDYSEHEYLAFGAYYGLAMIALGRSDWNNAGDIYAKAASKYPHHFNAAVALLEAGKAYEKANRYPQARVAYRTILTDYPKARSADAARDNLAKLEFMP